MQQLKAYFKKKLREAELMDLNAIITYKMPVPKENFTPALFKEVIEWQNDFVNNPLLKGEFQYKTHNIKYIGKYNLIHSYSCSALEGFKTFYQWNKLKELLDFIEELKVKFSECELFVELLNKPYHFVYLLTDNFEKEKVNMNTESIIEFLKQVDIKTRWRRYYSVLKTLRAQQEQEAIMIRNLHFKQETELNIHTKFLESNLSNIYKLYNLIYCNYYPAQTPNKEELFLFFNLLEKPLLFSMRSLCKKDINGFNYLATTVDDLNRNPLDFDTIFVIENETTFLDFPPKENALAIFGSGWKVSLLKVSWFKDKTIYYFGDSDEAGFQIADKFCTYYPAKLFLMDKSLPKEQEKIDKNLILEELSKLS